MITSPVSLPEAWNPPSIDLLKTPEVIKGWVDDFFQQLWWLLPDEISNNSDHPTYTCETSFNGGVYRVKWSVAGVSEFDFPGQVRNCLIRVSGDFVEGWFPSDTSLSFSFRTDRMKEEDSPRILQALELAEKAFHNLRQTNTWSIVWKLEDGKEIRQVFEDTRQAAAEALKW